MVCRALRSAGNGALHELAANHVERLFRKVCSRFAHQASALRLCSTSLRSALPETSLILIPLYALRSIFRVAFYPQLRGGAAGRFFGTARPRAKR